MLTFLMSILFLDISWGVNRSYNQQLIIRIDKTLNSIKIVRLLRISSARFSVISRYSTTMRYLKALKEANLETREESKNLKIKWNRKVREKKHARTLGWPWKLRRNIAPHNQKRSLDCVLSNLDYQSVEFMMMHINRQIARRFLICKWFASLKVIPSFISPPIK